MSKYVPILAALAIILPGVFSSPTGMAVPQDDWCRDGGDRNRGWACEVREMTLSPMNPVRVDAGPNGGISVVGWDRNEIRLEARVQAQAQTDAEAEAVVQDVEVLTGSSVIRSDGPATRRRESWSVSFRLSVPRSSNLNLETRNGGIAIEGVSGRIGFETTNGGVRLADLGGDVSGRTSNGGVRVTLTGSEWQGGQLDVVTTNGGVRLVVPEGYNARLETGTTNGGISIDFPITVQGRIGRHLSTDLGRGGSLIRVRTTNGGVTITRR